MTSPTKQSLPISSDSPIWAELSQSALVHNIEICSSAAGQTPIIAVIKANAYGHGMLDVAHIIEETIDPNTVSHLAVARLDEAALLRAEGIKRPILVLSGILSPQDLSLCAELSVDAVIHNKHTLDAYSALVSQNHTSINFWLKFNCGMNRLGLSKSEGQYALDLISSLPEANQKCFKGVLAHFSSSESCNTEHTHTQLQLFQETIQHFLDHYPSIISCIANSAAIFYHPESHHSAVRLGIKLYGLPSK
ncbi:MAG: alanine racemase, partial [Gammaproteobacteria bacterium]|nr:alanine racemase [Gammaproteobacteria bacterium]